MKKTKTQKGITLVALIITIIVLLILAVVAIRAVQGDGIIQHARNAATKYNEAQINELQKLEALEKEIEKNTTKWWELTPEESSNITVDSAGQGFVASKTDESIAVVIFYNEGKIEDIVIQTISGEEIVVYYFVITADENELGIEKNKWYIGINSTGPTEYTGPSPITMQDFEDGTIYSETYLQKIIDSFNK